MSLYDADVEKDDVAVKVAALQEHTKAELDVAGRFLAEMQARDDADVLLAPITPAEERRVVRKADTIIVPLLFVAVM